MRLPLRFCLPAIAGAMSAAILFAGWVPSAPKPRRTFTITISPESAVDIQQRAARREQAHHFFRGYNESWHWINALNLPAFWAAVLVDIEAQHRGEEVGLFTFSAAREMIVVAVVRVLIWYFVGGQFDVVIPRNAQCGACRRHRHHGLERVHDSWSAIDQVPNENGLASFRMRPAGGMPAK